MHRIFVFVFVIFATSVRPQEVLESSGEMPDTAAVLPELVLISGDGPVLIPLDDSNVTSAVAFLSNSTDDGRAETTTITAVTSTTRSPTTTTVAATTTTTLASTTVATTTERATTTTTIRPMTTTTTTSTTEKPTTTTTRKPTTRTTTRRTTTAKTTFSTMSSTTEDFNVNARQCFFVEEGFSCNVEVKCFGEGVIDCDAFEEEAQDTTEEDESPSPSDDLPDDLEESVAESTTVGLFPPELVGRVSPDRKPFLWNIDALPTVALDVDATNATTVAPPLSTTAETTRSATTERAAETTTATIAITIAAETTTESRNVTTALPENLSINETELESQASADNQTFLVTNDTDGTAENGTTSTTVAPEAEAENSTIVAEDTTTVATTVSTTEEPTTTTVTTTTTTQAPTTTTIRTTTRRRTGRRYRRNDGVVSAPLQAAALESSRQKKAPVRSCRLTGNLRCSPVPSLAICKGRSVCTVPPPTPGEKSEKSTSAKGVETWAIAVIAICAVAAAFTISLLIYLVVTSWKKLKVQPQNGVTTLTYVNSAQP